MSRVEIEEQNRRGKVKFQMNMMTVDLHISGFDQMTTKEELTAHFSQFGNVKSMRIDKRENNLEKENALWFELAPFALVSFDTPAAANMCLQQNPQILKTNGNTLTI